MFDLILAVSKKIAMGNLLLHRLLQLRKLHNGGILIEFTFCIPVCITLLFFVSDHYRFYELQSKAKTSAHLAASMIQQIGNTRTNKQLTKENFANISHASCFNFFHTKSMYTPWPFGVYHVLACYWVKRINSNSYQWQHCYGTTYKGTTPAGMNQKCKAIETKTLSQIEAAHPDLVCDNDGDERLLIEVIYRYESDNFDKKKLGFFILEPKILKPALDDATRNAFIYYLVITPKPGLFPGKVG